LARPTDIFSPSSVIFELPAIAFQSRTTDELIRHSGSI
jgi:hypothetical protein